MIDHDDTKSKSDYRSSRTSDHDHPHSHHDDQPGHKHDHGHEGHHHFGPHVHSHGAVNNIALALVLNLSFSVIEFIGGLWTGSIAILSDAVHDLGDSLALALALTFEKIANRESTATYSYGYRRLSLLSAVITCTFLITASVFILIEAVPRLWEPSEPKLFGMLGLAVLGIAVNGIAAWRVHKGATMNERVVSWHLIEDVFGWCTVFVGTIVIMLTGWTIIDPLLSIGFTLFILWGVLKTLRATIRLFLQAVPDNFDLPALRQEIQKVKGVVSTHDAHLWSIDGESHVFTVHVVVAKDITVAGMELIKRKIRDIVAHRGKIHVTMELESESEDCPDLNCVKI